MLYAGWSGALTRCVVLQNFLIHSGMNAAVADKTVSFMGHEEGVSTPYRIRMKTNEQAKELKAALDREIEFVKSKTGS